MKTNEESKYRRLTLELDEDDWSSVNEAIAERQSFRDKEGCLLPDGDGNLAGRLIAEICRGWLEMLSMRFDKLDGDEWKDKP